MSDYRWDARDYAQSSLAQLVWARELIAKLGLCGDEDVLDIGCGDGKVTAEIARHVPQGTVVGIDSSEAMVAHASASHGHGELGNVSFQCEDAGALPFEEQFDVVFSNATLHWVRDHLPVLAGICRSLRPGGRALLQMGGEGNAAEIIAAIDQMAAEPEWTPYLSGIGFTYAFYSPEQYSCWLPQTGLRALRLELIPKDMTQQGPDGLASWIRTTWLPYTQRVPEALRERFIAEIIERYLASHPLDDQGRAHVAMARLEALVERPGQEKGMS